MVANQSSSARSLVCLICLKRFEAGTTPGVSEASLNSSVQIPLVPVKVEPSQDDDTDQTTSMEPSTTWAPPPSIPVPPECNDKDEKTGKDSHSSSSSPPTPPLDTYERFLRFSGRYLKLAATTELLSNCAKQRENGNTQVNAFCATCLEDVASACDLHVEIQSRQLQLIGKLYALGEVMRRSTKSVSPKMQQSLFKSLGEELNVKAGRISHLRQFRRVLQVKCKNRGKMCAPRVRLHRGLLPDQWKFTYPATKQALMRLIFVFALGCINQQKSVEKEANDTTDNPGSKLPVSRRRRGRPRKTAQESAPATNDGDDSDDLKITAEEDDDADAVKVEDGQDDDPNWSSNEGPASPVSNTSSVSREINDNENSDSDPDFEEKPKRVTRSLGRKRKSSVTGDITDDKSPPPKKRGRRKRSGKPSTSSSTKKLNLTCPKCPDKSFNGYIGLRKHMKLVHNETVDYPCPYCGLMLKNSIEMLYHKRRVHGIRDKEKRNAFQIIGQECEICSEMFPTRRDRLAHKHEVHGILNKVPHQPFKQKRVWQSKKSTDEDKVERIQRRLKLKQCEICGTDKKSAFMLRKHLESDHEKEDDKKFSCYFCWKRFTVQQTVTLHVMAAHMKINRPFDCDYEDCSFSFKFFDEHLAHLKTHLVPITKEQEKSAEETVPETPQRKLYQCEVCGMGFLTEGLVDVHVAIHTEKIDDVYQCSKCHQTFESVAHLLRHHNMVHGRLILPHKCKQCDKRSFSKIALHSHIKRYHASEEALEHKVTCEEPDCGITFPNLNDLTVHMQRVHKKGTEHLCQICGRRFFKPSLLVLHMRSHKEPQFECTICKAKFKRRSTLDNHRSRDHNEEEDAGGHLKCTESDCDKLFMTRALLKSHLIRVHRNGQGFMCQECGKCYPRNSDLKAHMRSHSAAQWECDICHKLFKRHITMKQHKESIHNPNRVLQELVCDECGAVFISRTGLKFHYNSKHIPLRDRKYPCPNCPKRYHRGSLLHLHLKNCKGPPDKEAFVEPLQPKATGLNVKMKMMAESSNKKCMGLARDAGNTPVVSSSGETKVADVGGGGAGIETGNMLNAVSENDEVPKPSTSTADYTQSLSTFDPMLLPQFQQYSQQQLMSSLANESQQQPQSSKTFPFQYYQQNTMMTYGSTSQNQVTSPPSDPDQPQNLQYVRK